MANFLTLARMALIIPFAGLFLYGADWGMKAAFAIFALACLTDFFDGRVARARKEVSALGAALDPLADKLLIAAALILLLRNGVITGAGVWAVLIILLREILVTGLREALSVKGASLPVTGLAKWKTATQLLAAGFLLAAAPNGLLPGHWALAGEILLWTAAFLTFWTGADYSFRAAQILRRHDATP